MELFFDTETSGLILYKEPHDHPGQPWVVQVGCILSTRDTIHAEFGALVLPDDISKTIEPGAQRVHGISMEQVQIAGLPEKLIAYLFVQLFSISTKIICHNVGFDAITMGALLDRQKFHELGFIIAEAEVSYCTMLEGTDLCKLPGKYGNYKWPKLEELYRFLFNEGFIENRKLVGFFRHAICEWYATLFIRYADMNDVDNDAVWPEWKKFVLNNHEEKDGLL